MNKKYTLSEAMKKPFTNLIRFLRKHITVANLKYPPDWILIVIPGLIPLIIFIGLNTVVSLETWQIVVGFVITYGWFCYWTLVLNVWKGSE